MITVGVIRNGARYLSRHLRKNDYWSEGEAEVQGEWIGEGAKALGLRGAVEPEPFEALRTNCHPDTGARLTPGCAGERVAFFDIQLSAPKDVSVLAMVGGDVRVRDAFAAAAKVALAEMERYAAVRERRGDAHQTEAFRLTRNFVGALFLHDASRDLDPQLHVHAILAHATCDPERTRWPELQLAEMLRASPYRRRALYREMAGRLRDRQPARSFINFRPNPQSGLPEGTRRLAAPLLTCATVEWAPPRTASLPVCPISVSNSRSDPYPSGGHTPHASQPN